MRRGERERAKKVVEPISCPFPSRGRRRCKKRCGFHCWALFGLLVHQRRPRPRASFLSPAGSPRLCCLTNFRASATHSAHLVRAHCSIDPFQKALSVGRSVGRSKNVGIRLFQRCTIRRRRLWGLRGLISGELLSAPPLHLAQPFKDFRAPRYLRCFADFIFTVAKQGRKEEDTSFCQEDYALFLH